MSVSCGFKHTVIIHRDGALSMAGNNSFGQLGTGNEQLHDCLQTYIELFDAQSGLPMQTSSSFNSTSIVTDCGYLFMCGQNDCGQLGNGGNDFESNFTLIDPRFLKGHAALMASCGGSFTIVLTEHGEVYTFGSNCYGQLGHNTVPEQHGNGELWHQYFEKWRTTKPSQIPQEYFCSQRIVLVAAGETHAVVLTEDSIVYAWGRNEKLQLGVGVDDITTMKPRKVQVFKELKEDLGDGVVFVSAGGDQSLAVTQSGRLYWWGFLPMINGDDKYSDKPTLSRTPPSSDPVVMGACGHFHSLIVTKSGRVWSMGQNQEGQLGLNDNENRYEFELVSAVGFKKQKVVTVSAGWFHSVAVTKECFLFSWGGNACFQLGHADTEQRRVPYRVEQIRQVGLCGAIPTDHEQAILTSVNCKGNLFNLFDGKKEIVDIIVRFCRRLLPSRIVHKEGICRLLWGSGNDL